MSDQQPPASGLRGPVGGTARVTKAWDNMVFAMIHDLPKSLNEAAKFRASMRRRRKVR